jgi:hypothetical protein
VRYRSGRFPPSRSKLWERSVHGTPVTFSKPLKPPAGRLALLGLGFLDHAAGLGVALLDVLREHLLLNAPLAPATHLDGFQFTAADQRIGRG